MELLTTEPGRSFRDEYDAQRRSREWELRKNSLATAAKVFGAFSVITLVIAGVFVTLWAGSM